MGAPDANQENQRDKSKGSLRLLKDQRDENLESLLPANQENHDENPENKGIFRFVLKTMLFWFLVEYMAEKPPDGN